MIKYKRKQDIEHMKNKNKMFIKKRKRKRK